VETSVGIVNAMIEPGEVIPYGTLQVSDPAQLAALASSSRHPPETW